MKAALEEVPVAGSTNVRGSSTNRKRGRIGSILVPTDFSEESLKALRYATALLAQFEGALHLVHVHDVDYAYAVPPIISVAPVLTVGEVEAYCRGELQKLAAEHTSGDITPQLHCRSGRAFDQICSLASDTHADLIAVATHGHTGFKHLVLGSTTERVVRHAPCPVLVVREVERDFINADNDAAPLKLTDICVPVDFSACSANAVRYAVGFAKGCGAKLWLVHAVRVQPFVPADRFVAYSREPAPGVIERAARMQMRKFVKSIDFEGVPYETAVEIGRPADQICAFADAKGCALIITSTHGLTGFAHVMLGSVAEHVVRYARCPVLVVPHRSR
jgi:nucleotide-binding universal stress UspA family protein